MNPADLARWANRRVSHGEPAQPQAAPAPMQIAHAPALPPPPAGYVYAYSAQHQAYILLPMAPAPAAQQPYPAPAPYQPQPPQQYRQPNVVQPGSFGRVIPISSARVPSCELVKEAATDPYADLMQGVPDLATPVDVMPGQMLPETREAMAPLVAEFGGPSNEPFQVRGRAPIVGSTPELGSRPMPPDPNTPTEGTP